MSTTVNGHAVTPIKGGDWWLCERCKAQLLTVMQFVVRECPGPTTEGASERKDDDPPETVGTPYHHEDERECYRRTNGRGWWPYRFEDGVLNLSTGTICFRAHPATEGASDG